MWLRLLLLAVVLVDSPGISASLVGEPVITLRGDFRQPSALAVDQNSGKLFVLDGLRRRMSVFDAEGVPLGKLNLPDFDAPHPVTDIVLDKDRLFVADPAFHRILILDQQGSLLQTLSPGGDAEPSALKISGRRLWWSDRRNHRLCRSLLDNIQNTICQGGRGENAGQFRYPYMLAEDGSGYILAVDVLNARVQVFSPKGQYFGQMGRFGIQPGNLYRPNGILFRGDNAVLVSDAWMGTITIFRHRKAQGLLQRSDGQPWVFSMPVGLASWHERIYVADLGDNSVRVLTVHENGVDGKVLPVESISRDSKKNCLQCHMSWADDYRMESDLPVLPVAQERMCLSCHHGAVIDSRSRLAQGQQHPTLHQRRDGRLAGDSLRYEDDQLPASFPLQQDKYLYCGSCHTPHDKPQGGKALGVGRHNPWLRQVNADSDICLDCHASKQSRSSDRKNKELAHLNHPLGIRMQAPPGDEEAGYAKRSELQKGLPDSLKLAGARLGKQGQIICQSCHQVHGAQGSPLLITGSDKAALCVACHRSQYAKDKNAARKKGIHPVNITLEEEVMLAGKKLKKLDCLSCHSVHEAQAGTSLLPKGQETGTLCQHCHERQNAKDRKAAQEKGIHPVNIKLDKPIKLAGHETAYLECRSCHAVHDGVKTTPALVENHQDGQLCHNCHADQQGIVHTDHDFRQHSGHNKNQLQELWSTSGLCSSCHSLHRGKPDSVFLSVGAKLPDANLDMPNRDRLCMSCHHKNNKLKAREIENFTHPWKTLILRSDPKAMPLLDENGKIAEFGRIACITCHDPHVWDTKKNNPAGSFRPESENTEGTVQTSFLRTNNAANSFCVTCHGRETKIKYKYYHDVQGREKKIEYLQ
jgi:predicted CXXCH cytochrome family protein